MFFWCVLCGVRCCVLCFLGVFCLVSVFYGVFLLAELWVQFDAAFGLVDSWMMEPSVFLMLQTADSSDGTVPVVRELCQR